MGKFKVLGSGILAFCMLSPEFSHAIRLSGPAEEQYLDINLLVQTWFRYQKISDENRPNFVNAPSGNFDTSFRRIRVRMGGSYNEWFKFNFVFRLNNTGRDAYIAPFGGQPQGYLREGGILGGRFFSLHELDLILVPSRMFDAKGWTIDLHLGFPRVPLGREQYQRVYDNFEVDRSLSTERWTHFTVGNVTGRSYGGFIHLRNSNNGQGFKNITWDGFLGIFDGFKGIGQPWDETVRNGTGGACDAACLSQLRSNSKDSFLYTFRTTLMIGEPEGNPRIYNWLYKDTYFGRRKGITLGLSYAMQNDIDQELITDTQGPAPGLAGSGNYLAGAGSVQVRLPYLVLPNPIQVANVRNHPVDMQMYGADIAIHYGPFTLLGEVGQHQFKGVWLSNTLPSVDFKHKWLITKAGWVINPGRVHLWEPYVSYLVWDPDIKWVDP